MNSRATSVFLTNAPVLVTRFIASETCGCAAHRGFSLQDEASVRDAVQEYAKALAIE
jgi:hypothetical protein